ncbi:hypothetical protein COL5a_009655 [Colletotrichum fioriniae]|nr:hypothetical protein COL5a_009655 [Colletotrichum fioriniae]
MSSSAAPSLAHRSIANIRTETGSGISGGPASPHTPSRNISSTFGSPSSLRAEEDIIVIELGSRFIKLGFAGEPAPKAVLSLGPEQLRRAPIVSLMSSAVTSVVGAGTRSALVVDLGWAETSVTSVYEYREIRTTRTTRAGKMLVNETHNLLQDALSTSSAHSQRTCREREQGRHSLSFEECEEVACRLVWCRQVKRGDLPSARQPEQQQSGGEALPTVEEQDESPPTSPVEEERSDGNIEVLIQSVEPVENLTLPFQQLSEPCENTYFAPHYSRSSFDDDELPVHHLIYQHLVQLPIDARAVCMSRIVFIGGCSRVIGLKRRIFDELSKLVHERGWDPVQGRAPKQYENNALLKRGSRRATEGPTEIEPPARETEERRVTGEDEPRSAADVIEDSLKKRDSHYPRIQGALRPLGSLGPWGGASLACQLKVMAMANIDRELWLQQGVNGASRPSEVDVKAQQRQSMGPGGLMRGAGGQSNWTLGAWGTL